MKLFFVLVAVKLKANMKQSLMALSLMLMPPMLNLNLLQRARFHWK